ncbi:tRNA pseudouridine(13) synthase TruD [Planctomicrobium sp. SH664]|uniref:tRNA pseudouridine(13) synthase TruD n=1 Tax=Planctomicrobium sp. SH664 TaxID=3448125 RepID=UPI003F5B1F61
MKLRRLAEDFRVDEDSTLPIGAQGEFAVYRLHKRHWTTLDALDRISRELHLPRRNLMHAGLKDRHAETSQLITARRGPQQSFHNEHFRLEYLGQSRREIRSDDISGNRFHLVLRGLRPEEVASAGDALPDIARSGVVNYFDDQRFGSYFPGCGFVAEPWLRGNYEEALRLTFVEPDEIDDAEEREQKRILRKHWGEWALCKQLLGRSHRRSIVTFLDDRKGDFKGAWSRVNSDLRGLFLSALQSDLWNQIVSELVKEKFPESQRQPLQLKPGPVQIPTDLSAEQVAQLSPLEIPLPSARLELEPGEVRNWIDRGLAVRGWKLEELKVKFPRDRFFARSSRRVIFPVEGLTWSFAVDELSPTQQKLELDFLLPRGCYATMVVKRLMLEEES